MELLREIYERDLGLSGRDATSRRHGGNFWMRRAVRGIIFNTRYEVALLHRKDGNYYKLPGGGIEASETLQMAMQREARVELGSEIELTDDIGLVIEYQDERELLQFSYGYIGQIRDHEQEEDNPANEEAGATISWRSLKDAIQLLEKHEPATYEGRFIHERDLCFLKQLHR
ncbi:NUDIX hydrolase [Paenibacillus sp. 1011MAR3C5]|uniref:NUDIX hydrolase n=1 Tax=Paenibacillus sp. 1011MAR3C5 TaxID=1675787 RepID=UPI000E6BAC17|nr:NUDIX hydrolase [Paenibacillus sp. 1011MAR3C5]RJE86899.1 NUDIX hydrolase [Paenibacillus sp. 1011MAR3C5]